MYYPDGTDTSVSYEALFDGFTLKCVALLLLSFLILLFSGTGSPHLPHLLRVARAREETKEDRQNMSKREKDSFTTQ